MGLVNGILNSKSVWRLKRKMAKWSRLYFRLKKLSASASEDYRTVKILQTYKIDKVIDIGANTGQFAESLFDFGYKGKIISFEPTTKAYNKLCKRAAKYKNWEVAERMAIGNYDGKVDINVSEDSLFSSVKKISEEYSGYNKTAEGLVVENVDIYKMDSLIGRYLKPDEIIMLKIDTQGLEKEVLEGAEKCLEFVKAVKTEIPLMPIYDDVEWRIPQMMNFFTKVGFLCISLSEVAVNNNTGVVHEVDGIFIKI